MYYGLVLVHFLATGEAVGWQGFTDREFEGIYRCSIPRCFDSHPPVIINLVGGQGRDDDEIPHTLFYDVDCPWERFQVFDRGEEVFHVDVVAQCIPVISHSSPVPGRENEPIR